MTSAEALGSLSSPAVVGDTHLEDAHVLGRVASGDREALSELFDRHSPKLLGVLVGTLGQRAEAEEVLQEVFLQVWKQAHRYTQSRSSPSGWLLMMARSRAIDRLRSRDARVRREEDVAQERFRQVTAPVGTERLEAEERHRQVKSALALLPDEQRTCVELAFFEGLSQTQIAERLRLPLGTVKSRVLLGMKKLRQHLGPRT